jgi:hypothetical protein
MARYAFCWEILVLGKRIVPTPQVVPLQQMEKLKPLSEVMVHAVLRSDLRSQKS